MPTITRQTFTSLVYPINTPKGKRAQIKAKRLIDNDDMSVIPGFGIIVHKHEGFVPPPSHISHNFHDSGCRVEESPPVAPYPSNTVVQQHVHAQPCACLRMRILALQPTVKPALDVLDDDQLAQLANTIHGLMTLDDYLWTSKHHKGPLNPQYGNGDDSPKVQAKSRVLSVREKAKRKLARTDEKLNALRLQMEELKVLVGE